MDISDHIAAIVGDLPAIIDDNSIGRSQVVSSLKFSLGESAKA